MTEMDESGATIARLEARIRELEERDSSALLRDILQQSDVIAATIGHAPYRALLDGIVTAARRLFDAGACSVALLDRSTDELVFEAATGAGAEEVLKLRFPAHQGIAGWVAMTGEPIAVSDVRSDPRWASTVARSTGYIPRSIMAAPLIVRDEVEGVISVLDKAAEGSFGLGDMELLGLFARPAAVAVEQARLVGGIGRLLVAEVQLDAAQKGQYDLAGAAARALNEDDASGETIELARLVHQIARRGDRGRRLALEVLDAVSRHL